jgi:hypothetical protein
VGPYPAGYHAGTMRRAITLAALLNAGCPRPNDSGFDGPWVENDPGIGSILWLHWEQAEADTMYAEFRAEGGAWLRTPDLECEPGPQRLPLLGLPYDAEVEIELHRLVRFGVAEPALTSAHTDPLPEGLPNVEILAEDPALQDPDTPWLLTSLDHPGTAGTPEGTWAFILDRQGRIVWALETPAQRFTLHPRISADGAAILMDLNSHFGAFDRGAASQVQRLGIDGGIQRTWDTPGLHHPYTDLPDGSIAWGAWGEGLETLEIIDPDGIQRTLWDCADFHTAQGMPDTPCSSNTVSWDEASDSFLHSFYTTHTVVRIDGSTGEDSGWFGQMPGSWTFEPAESGFVWQHGGYITQDGTLLVSMRRDALAEETVAREYQLDEGARTLTEIWSYGQGEGLYAPELGEATRLPGGNTLLNYGTGLRIREVTTDGEVAWDLALEPGSMLGRSEPIGDLYGLWDG